MAASPRRHSGAQTLRFGTDGVRGVANTELTPEYALLFGRAAAQVLGASSFVVGRDTRISGPLLEGALCAGLASEGAAVVRLGMCPTPAVAWACAHPGTGGANGGNGAAGAGSVAGVMISASHNPFGDNGLKAFAPGGLKLSDEAQDRFEQVLDELGAGRPPARSGAAVGRIADAGEQVEAWQAGIVASLEGRTLGGLRVVVDCANGAASLVAPATLRELGAAVTVLAAEPDGMNINDGCGSTHPGLLQAAVREQGADLGLAFDGDADRLLAVDGNGVLVDGDQLIALCAIDRHERGCLAGDTVVVTVMTNLGFRLGMATRGIAVEQTAVGDRYVLEALERGGWSLGGEQSGHVIFRDLATTGDGLLTALQVLDVVCRSGRSLAELAAAAMTRLPQVLRNVAVTGSAAEVGTAIADHIAQVSQRLGERGRVLVRPSGTEPLLRIMAEAADEHAAAEAVDELVRAAQQVSARSRR